MRLVKSLFIFIIATYLGLLFFMPKTQGYYKLEQLLNKQGIVVSNEKIESTLKAFKIAHPVIYYQGVDVARVSSVDIRPYILANSIKAKNIELLGVAKKLLKDIEIHQIDAKESLLDPYHIKLDINGSFGTAVGFVDLNKQLVHIDITKPKNINTLRRVLKQGEKGWYYERKF